MVQRATRGHHGEVWLLVFSDEVSEVDARAARRNPISGVSILAAHPTMVAPNPFGGRRLRRRPAVHPVRAPLY